MIVPWDTLCVCVCDSHNEIRAWIIFSPDKTGVIMLSCRKQQKDLAEIILAYLIEGLCQSFVIKV